MARSWPRKCLNVVNTGVPEHVSVAQNGFSLAILTCSVNVSHRSVEAAYIFCSDTGISLSSVAHISPSTQSQAGLSTGGVQAILHNTDTLLPSTARHIGVSDTTHPATSSSDQLHEESDHDLLKGNIAEDNLEWNTSIKTCQDKKEMQKTDSKGQKKKQDPPLHAQRRILSRSKGNLNK